MKSTLVLPLIVLLSACASGQKSLYTAPEANFAAYNCVVVAPFRNMSRLDSGGLGMADAVANSLYATGGFQLVERSEAQRYLASQGHDTQGLSDTALAAEMGRALSADAVLLGTVNDYWYRSVDARPEVSITLRVVDVQSEEVVLVASRTYSPQLLRPGPKLLTAAADFLAVDLLAPLSVERPAQSSRRRACGYPVPGQIRHADAAPTGGDDEMADLDRIEPEPSAGDPAAPAQLSTAAAEMLQRLVSGERFELEGMDFDLDELSFRDEARARQLLGDLAQALDARPRIHIRIEAHSDGLGDADANRVLTQKRAELLKGALSSHYGISSSRIEADGLGGDKPLLPNINRRNREMNRRVEISVLQGP